MPRSTALALPGIIAAPLALFATLTAAAPSAPRPAPPVTHEVRMVLEGGAYRFAPASITARPGDLVKFILVSGAPHNVAFDAEQIADGAEAALAAGMANQMSPLAGPLMMNEGDSYTIALKGIEPGVYPFFCMPHVAMAMTGRLVVK